MTTDQDFQFNKANKENISSSIDIKRIAFQALRYWYVVVLSLGVALVIAFYQNRYAERIYPVTASIIILEKEETSGAELLYKNAIVDQYRNYLNEPYILKSYPLIQRVIEELNFTVSFYTEGYILTTEAYNYLPITAKITKRSFPAAYSIKLLDENSYSLEIPASENSTVEKFTIGDTITFHGNRLMVEKVPGRQMKDVFNVPYLMVINDPFGVASQYVGKLSASWAEEGAGIINLNVNGPIPEKEIDFINGLVKNYQQYDLEKKNETADRTVKFIRKQLVKMTDSLKIFEGQLQQFKKDNRTSGHLDGEAQRMFAKVEGLELQRAEVQMKSNYYDYLRKSILESKNLDEIILPTSFGVVDPLMTGFVSEIANLQLELKIYYSKAKEISPAITGKVKRLEELKNDVLKSTETLRATDKIRLDFLNKQIADVEKQIGFLPLAERQLISIQRNYSLLENLYVFLMQKMSEAEISKASSTSDIVSVNPPMLAGGAITPKISQNYLFATILGLGLPILAFVLIELFNTRIQSKEDIDKITSIPFIGGIGHKKSLNNLEVLNSPKSSIAESFRALRSNLNYFIDQKTKATFLISSSISGEGKTFTSINLASIFALTGKKTLIVGADMRKPKIYQDLQLNNDRGLSTYLSGLDSFDGVVQKTSVNDLLDMVSGGPVPPNPSELLLSPRMTQFIDEARAKYDFIIIDTPPMAIVTDAFVLAPFADHMLFLVRQNYTPKMLIKNVNDFYVSGKLKNISIVLNDIYKSGPGYGYGGYGYDYYSYGYGYGNKKGKDGYGYYSES